jgi:hypothetical protein
MYCIYDRNPLARRRAFRVRDRGSSKNTYAPRNRNRNRNRDRKKKKGRFLACSLSNVHAGGDAATVRYRKHWDTRVMSP